jgi:hypothetical protein
MFPLLPNARLSKIQPQQDAMAFDPANRHKSGNSPD